MLFRSSYYFNDDFKLSQRLTLNFGIRYDYFGKMVQGDDKFVNIEQNGLVPTGFATPQTSAYGRGLLQADRNNWSPRFGFAYQPAFSKDMVIRGGYGLFFGRIPLSLYETQIRNDGKRQYEIFIDNPTYPDPFLGGTTRPPSIRVIDPKLQNPYINTVMISYERTFLNNL